MTFSQALVGLLTLAFLQACLSFVHVPAVLRAERPACRLRPAPPTGGERGKAVQQSMATQECDVFDWLAKGAGVDKVVSLGMVEGGYRGLMTDCDVEEGQVLLEVPAGVCLWSNRDGVVSGLRGQTDMCWEAAGDLREPVSDEDFTRGMTWDVRLALGLLEATADPQTGGEFWDVYGRLLPRPHTVTVPFCLPERLLAQLHNDGMAERARKQINRLRSLYPDLMQTLLSHRITAGYVSTKDGEGGGGASVESDIAPMALAWAFAMVRSRALTGQEDRFAFVPFLEMANHGFAPTTNFTYEEPGVFRLRAMRDMRVGEEATISYGESMNPEQLMVQYGFPVPSNVPLARPLADSATLRDLVSARAEAAGNEGPKAEAAAEGEEALVTDWGEIVRRGLMDELFMRGQQRFAREARGDKQRFETLVRRALPLIPSMATAVGELMGDGEAVEGATAYLEGLQAYQSANFPTSVKQDKELLRYCLGEGRGKVDQRLAEVVRYRIGRKEAHSLAVDILQEYLSPHGTPEDASKVGEGMEDEPLTESDVRPPMAQDGRLPL